MEFKHKNKYETTRDRVTKFQNNRNMRDKDIIEFLSDEILKYRERIEKQIDAIEELQNKQQITNNAYENLKGLNVEINGIKGTIENINTYKESYYADNIKYYEQTFCEIEILTGDMYTIKIRPISIKTIEELCKSKKIIEEYKLNNRVKII